MNKYTTRRRSWQGLGRLTIAMLRFTLRALRGKNYHVNMFNSTYHTWTYNKHVVHYTYFSITCDKRNWETHICIQRINARLTPSNADAMNKYTTIEGARIAVGDVVRGYLPPHPPLRKKIREQYFSGKNHIKFRHFAIFSGIYHVKFGNFVNFSGKYHIKFGHFVNFHAYVFRQKCHVPPKVDWAPTPMVARDRCSDEFTIAMPHFALCA